jgi:uncharacterized membrane protein YbhN (UPF0104 family)
MRRRLQRLLPVLVSAGILVWLLEGIDRQALLDALDARVVAVMGAALLVYGAVTLWIEATSIQRLLLTVPAQLPLWTIARVKSASYLLAILHYALGAAALSLLLHRRAALPLARAASIVILIASVDLIVVLGLAGASAASLQSGPEIHAGLLLTALVLFFGGLTLLRVPTSLGPLERLRELAIFEGLRTVPPARLLELFALRTVFALCFVSVCAAAFHAFEVPVPLLRVVPGMLIVALVAAVPVAVAGLGTSQAAFVLLFAGYASREELLVMSLLLSAGLMLLRAAMGLVFAREFTREALRETRAQA